MEIIGIVITIVGTFASLAGAYISWDQSKKAKAAAKIAKAVEKNITHHRSTSDIAKLKEKVESIISSINVYGHGGSQTRYETANHDANSESIQRTCLSIQECISCFSGNMKKEVEALINDIEVELEAFNQNAISHTERKASGKKILAKFSMLNSKFKSKLDQNVETGA
jgi:hypothetical protein